MYPMLKWSVLALCAALPLTGMAKGDPVKGQTKAQACVECHGAMGNTPVAGTGVPKLAGQYEDYLRETLLAYQRGWRKNPIMKLQVEGLSKDDIRNLAAYFAKQPGDLYTKTSAENHKK